MSRRWLGYATMLSGAALLVWAIWGRESDEERIARALETLAHDVSFSEPIGNAVFRAAHLNKAFQEVLAEQIRVTAPELGTLPSERRALALAAARVSTGFGSLEVELRALEVHVSEERAVADAVAVIEGGPRWGEGQQRSVHFELAQVDGEWRVTALKLGPVAGAP